MIGPFCSPFPRNSCSSSPPPPAADVVIAISFSLESNNCERAGGMAVAQLIIVFFFFHCSCRPTTARLGSAPRSWLLPHVLQGRSRARVSVRAGAREGAGRRIRRCFRFAFDSLVTASGRAPSSPLPSFLIFRRAFSGERRRAHLPFPPSLLYPLARVGTRSVGLPRSLLLFPVCSRRHRA